MEAKENEKIKKTYFSRADLKWIAAISMVIDHIAVIFVSQQIFPVLYNGLRLLGRLSFPIICFMLVQGFHYTSDKRRYFIRLLIWGMLSEIPFDLAFYGKFVYLGAQNVLFTLALGLVVIGIINQILMQEKQTGIVGKTLGTVFCGMILAGFLRTDYSYWGILTIAAFYLGQFQTANRRRWLVIFICAMQGIFQLCAASSLLFTENYSANKKGKVSGRFFYWFYPIHLLVLWSFSILFL